jgi:predicted transcriptional regulator
LVTQTGFVEYLSEEHALTLDKTGLTVGDLGLARHHVHTVPVEGTTALDALKEMRDRKVTGLGVVNKNGVLLDVISASDLMVRRHHLALPHDTTLTQRTRMFS